MFTFLKSNKIRSWCLFDFGISSYPTLIITFFYGAFFAKQIASSPLIGTSLWGFALSIGSTISFLLFSILLIFGWSIKKITERFFLYFFYTMIIFTFGLVLFDKGINQFIPLFFVVISFICFEFINLFYNISLHKVRKKKKEGTISNLGWAFGYLGGLLSLLFIYMLLQITSDNNFTVFNFSIFLLIGPFVAVWLAFFGRFHFKNMKSTNFKLPKIEKLLNNIKTEKLTTFLISYFFFNNAVISIFAFASMIAAFLFGLTETQILLLGVFINLSGVFGCLILGRFEDRIGSLLMVKICISWLLMLTSILYFVENIIIFWIISLSIGFFIGPIQASSRSVLIKQIKSANQMPMFSLYSMFGNLCSILGPFIVGLIIDQSNSLRYGILVIPLFFLLSLFPFLARYFKINV